MEVKGKLIVIEGTDGSGKATQTAKLKERIQQAGQAIYTTSFPNYDSNSSALVKMYLNGEISGKADDISSKAAATFYAVDRYVTFKKEFESIYKEGGQTLLFDRYAASNIIHQGAKIVSKYNEETQKPEMEKALVSFIQWLDNLEHFDLGIPKADLVIYLNVPIEYTIKLRKERLNKITGKEKQDIHESDISHLINASKAGIMAAEILGWKVIECIKDEKMRTVEDISEEIWQTVQNS